MTTKQTGDFGEIIAIKYLQKHGYKLLDTNFKFGRFGEIDLIVSKDDLTIFIEVKYRQNTFFGKPEEAIIKSKLSKCKKTMEYYCAVNSINFEKIRFDVITILKQQKSYRIVHYKNIEI